MVKIWQRDLHKAADKSKKEQEDAEKRAKNIEEAKLIKIVEDLALPSAKQVKIRGLKDCRDQRVKIFGWVHRLRRQGMSNTQKKKEIIDDIHCCICL